MTSSPFVSYAPNREDVVLRRALAGVSDGRYVEVGLDDPKSGSLTYGSFQQGWSGIVVAAEVAAVDRLRAQRPRDVVVHGAERLDEVLGEAGWENLDLHLLAVDARAAECADPVMIDVTRWRPWVVVLAQASDATQKLVVDAGYDLCLFDGFSRFYVAADKADELRPALSTPANPLDDYTLHATWMAQRERDETVAELRRRDEEQQAAILRWRSAALRAWATSAEVAQEQELRKQIEEHLNHVRHVDEQLAAMKRTLSWRVTRPLRTLKTVARRGSVH